MSSFKWVPPKSDWQIELERLEKEKVLRDVRYESAKEKYLNKEMTGSVFREYCAQCDYVDSDILRHKIRKPKEPIDALRLNGSPINHTLYFLKRERFEILLDRFNECDNYTNLLAIVRFVNLEIENG